MRSWRRRTRICLVQSAITVPIKTHLEHKLVQRRTLCAKSSVTLTTNLIARESDPVPVITTRTTYVDPAWRPLLCDPPTRAPSLSQLIDSDHPSSSRHPRRPMQSKMVSTRTSALCAPLPAPLSSVPIKRPSSTNNGTLIGPNNNQRPAPTPNSRTSEVLSEQLPWQFYYDYEKNSDRIKTIAASIIWAIITIKRLFPILYITDKTKES